ncbi:nucleotidyltransferase family protein, partial [Streptomyces sp. NPDC096068]|uniref:nucleotidyltransferase family protein n=1 Tax=Streptomyces sp. NPDC096068 TaxID=3155424 RepID=UPI00332A9EDD
MNLTEDPAPRRSANGKAYPASAGHDHGLAGTGSPEPRKAPREDSGARGAHEGDATALPPDHTQAILETTKKIGALLKESGCPFALIGGVAAYAHGIPVRLQHDTDFAVRREDAETVTNALREHGVRIVDPPEDWLVKARSGGEEIDLIFSLAGRPVTTELLSRAQTLPVDSVHMPVIAPTDLMVSRLLAFSDHHCDFGTLLPVARGLRERIDWTRVRQETEGAPMAAAFLYLLELLAVGDDGDGEGDGERDHSAHPGPA